MVIPYNLRDVALKNTTNTPVIIEHKRSTKTYLFNVTLT